MCLSTSSDASDNTAQLGLSLNTTFIANPGLLDASGKPVPVEMMAVKPRTTLQ